MDTYKNLSLEDLPNEVWKDVVGYEGLYQVSNLGRVKMLPRKVLANKSIKNIKEHILKQTISKKGYLYVDFWVNNKVKRFAVHRLVLSAFLGNSEISLECNHKNENRSDNRLDNLEWLTHRENLNYGNRTNKQKQKMLNHPSLSLPVIQYNMVGQYIAEYKSLREAGRVLGFSFSCIKECCKGRCKSTHGYIFKYKNK